MSTFQITLLGIFIVVGVAAVFVFAGFIPLPCFTASCEQRAFGGEVTLWGTFSQRDISPLVQAFNEDMTDALKLIYVAKDSSTFESELVSALASGKGPDLVLMPHDSIFSQRDKFLPLPFESYSARQFRDTFVDEGTLFLATDGIRALPLYADPLVLYWNKDLFASAGVAAAPRYWEQFLILAEKLTVRDDRGNIAKSAVALGGVRNATNLKEILSTLLMQVGDPVTVATENGVAAVLGESGDGLASAVSAVRFYTEFSDPAKSVYSWNSALPNSRDAFAAGQVAMYFGYAHEYAALRRQNPHLNFDVAMMPQREKTNLARTTFGALYGVGVMKSSRNVNTAFRAALALSGNNWGTQFAALAGLPSAQRAVIGAGTQDPILDIFNRSALIANAWYDPSPKETDIIFSDMIEAVTSGQNELAYAIRRARDQIAALLQ